MRRHCAPVEMMPNFGGFVGGFAVGDWRDREGMGERVVESNWHATPTLAAKMSVMYVMGVMEGCVWGLVGEVAREMRAGTRGWGEKQATRIAA